MRMCKGGEKTGVVWKEGEAAHGEYTQRSWRRPLAAHSEQLLPLRVWLEAS